MRSGPQIEQEERLLLAVQGVELEFTKLESKMCGMEDE